MNSASDLDTPVSPITGLPYIELMRHCASIGSLGSLREMIQELEDMDALSDEFSQLMDYCKRASEFEGEFGVDSLLDLNHRSVRVLIENVFSPEDLADIRRRQEAISGNAGDAARRDALMTEARSFV